jgi:hypothetical protein
MRTSNLYRRDVERVGALSDEVGFRQQSEKRPPSAGFEVSTPPISRVK